ncbi:ATPase, histidine kinase-, DNA gyrase B, putative (macronuclear) [Tetrahymena thermophila SB210]|uniref:ATPase, histidine kinase-, DNA gyrase B, putative n=1 Tax=Tetrahymena thermophila (strain SB210) TaxID=312017 RepID=Q245A2_TETTS|nr:ATPase, histidine kinase-, DNA gyrase B, putative [Tetrahymena thermophila SB210]EAS03335.2 ATPase, histidine kinase-, DNA gyrase B, putative [Tetrahymena thermophila SB210]|eukprot:XP_001023580.2 ATPase, histidine kinase-, DNA gyrase B, putative [Tetrahymena thermophila SB210]
MNHSKNLRDYNEDFYEQKQYSTFFDTEINILIVDDDQSSSFVLKIIITSTLKQFNKNLLLYFTTIYQGEECIRGLAKIQKCYYFLFIDAQMPEIDGYESIRLFYQLNLRKFLEKQANKKQIFSQLQIIMSSGFQKEEEKLYIYRIKFYLQKPVEEKQQKIFLQKSILNYPIKYKIQSQQNEFITMLFSSYQI